MNKKTELNFINLISLETTKTIETQPKQN